MFTQVEHIGILDVSPIFTQMHRDPAGTGPFAESGNLEKVGIVGSSRLT
jgi:predicted dienelactone hydrolase